MISLLHFDIMNQFQLTHAAKSLNRPISSTLTVVNFFQENNKVSPALLNQIKEMTTPFEVAVKSKKEWENAILQGYSLFHELVKHNGGKIHFDMLKQSATYEN